MNKDIVDLGIGDFANKVIMGSMDEGVLDNEAPIVHDMVHDPPPQAKRRRITMGRRPRAGWVDNGSRSWPTSATPTCA